MNHLPGMHIFQSECHLIQIALRLHLRQPLPSFYQLVQRLVGTDLQQYINTLRILKAVLEPHDVLKVQRLVDLDLRGELSNVCVYLLFGFGAVQRRLLNDLGCIDLLGVE